jgi:inner membrane protein
MPVRFWLLSAACAILPDADAIGFLLGVPYNSTFGHRGFTHSILFALIIGLLVTELFFGDAVRFSRQWWLLVLFFFVSTVSHPLLDMLTNGGLGVALFSPFSNERYFFPWHPIQVSPIGVAPFFSTRGMRVILSEMLWVWLPGGVAVGIVEVWRRVVRA